MTFQLFITGYVALGVLWAVLLTRYSIRDGSLGKLMRLSIWKGICVIIIGYILSAIIWPYSIYRYFGAELFGEVFR